MSWPDDAVISEIYPPSFADSNGGGIGDLTGVLEHLDHLAWSRRSSEVAPGSRGS